MLTRIEDIQRDIHTSNRNLEQSILRRPNETHLDSSVCTKRLKVGFQSVLFSFSIEFSSEQDTQQTKNKTVLTAVKKSICTIRLPTWFVQDQYNLAFARSKNGWLFHPVVYRAVDENSLFFKACRIGDLETMRMLLTTKQAYLGDRQDCMGSHESALSRALRSGQFGACKLLIDAGILSFFQSYDYTIALQTFSFNLPSNRNECRKALRWIELEQNLDSGWMNDIELASICYKILQDLRLNAEEVGGSALYRFETRLFPQIFATSHINTEVDLDLLSELLGSADNLREIRANASCSTWLLFVIAHKLSNLFATSQEAPPPLHVQACCFALGVACGTGLDLHACIGELPKEWKSSILIVANSEFAALTPFAFIFAYWSTLYYDDYEAEHRYFQRLDAALRLWVNTLYNAGVDLAAYAEHEVWTISKILARGIPRHYVFCRLLYGPEPDDWRVETGLPGEVYPAFFWRSVESAPIGEDLAAKVIDLVHRVENLDNVQRNVPGSWQMGQDEPTWDVHGWLQCKEDSDMAQMETDLEQLDDEEFYEEWHLGSMIEEWPYCD
jgi:hypothetical protein